MGNQADAVITGVATDPVTRSVALDLERRGFVVFCAVPPSSDSLIEQEGKHDLRALPMDIAEVIHTSTRINSSRVQARP
jgi:hypothetical protein